MCNRTTNLELVSGLMKPYLPIHGLNLEEWLENKTNVCLINEDEDLALFEFDSNGIYSGHYFFKSRGKKAVASAQKFLQAFIAQHNPQVIKGLTPLENLGARWLSRHIGFKGFGVVQTPVGPCELFILTKKDWENTLNE